MTPSAAPAAPLATPFASIADAVADLRAGRMVVVVDDADRENEGDLTLAAEHATPEAINFMARHGRGLICVALTPERLAELGIRLMTEANTSNFGTAFCDSVDARAGVSTGISASDRARSILALVDPATRPHDLARPGHIFPLRARPGGVLARAGQTEAAVDLARLAGLRPAGVICEVMNEDGSMARVPDLARFCAGHGLKMITVADLIRHRLEHERHVHRVGEADHATAYGRCRLIAYRSRLDHDAEFHSALVFGNPAAHAPALVRVQSHCLMAAWGANGCACAGNLSSALARIQAEGSGVLIYLHQNSPGYALTGEAAIAHLGPAASEPSDHRPPAGAGDASPSVQRQIGLGAQMLADLGIRELRLLTDHPRRLAGLEGYGLRVVEHVPLHP
ncbi:MAG TPA: 3,4-dihydroxy-2-butanone-4-phosphate synthase [Terriglobales bacterium]|nr:3,4-dihydroxy-2-butanone-4-phosphate synthase [Terriglobales bacterium]